MACVAGVRVAVAAMCLLTLSAGESQGQTPGGQPNPLVNIPGGQPDPKSARLARLKKGQRDALARQARQARLARLTKGQRDALAEAQTLFEQGLEAYKANNCHRLVGRRDRLWDILNNRADPFWVRHGLADASTKVTGPITADLRAKVEILGGLKCPTVAAMYEQLAVEVSGAATKVKLPQVQGGTRMTGGGEFPIASSEEWMRGWSTSIMLQFGANPYKPNNRASGERQVPRDDVMWDEALWRAVLGPHRQYVPEPSGRVRVGASYNEFEGSASGTVPIGENSGFVYFVPNPVNGSTGLNAGPTGQSTGIQTKGHTLDVLMDYSVRQNANGLGRGEREHSSAELFSAERRWMEFGVGLYYRSYSVEHRITQQSLTFDDLNSLINLDIKSHFIAPILSWGAGFEPSGPSGLFGGVTGSIAPGLLVTDASAGQISNCGPCGPGSPEYSWSQSHNFGDTSFSAMLRAQAYAGYQFNPDVRLQIGGGLTYMSRVDSIAVPVTPPAQPVGLDHGSSTEWSAHATLRVTIPPPR